ncbi:agouti-related protein [Monodelphis domestica]|uniref:Agouti-related protein n=1 Tax=Monodelphis domestica TaxID=13616 RepID=F6XD58_MONDO|nr:agouti-related protein [Monodelphis domestica]
MLNALLLSWAMLQGFPIILSAPSSQQYPDAIGSRLSRSSQALYPGLLHSAGAASLGLSGPGIQPELEQMASELAGESFMQDTEALAPGMLDLQDREERSPRRCVRLLESCLGHQVPCCDPCATCYCRFFNAFCYCRKISTNYPCSRN